MNPKKISYGIIAYSTKPIIKFLLVQRKHSHSYDALLRGHYDFDNLTYIKQLVSRLTPNERCKLLKYDHNYLWNKLWSFSTNNSMFTQEKAKACDKFKQLVTGTINSHGDMIKLQTLCEQIEPEWNEPEWGFPKGKKFYNEYESDAALREFLEETGLDERTLTMHKEDDIGPITEVYIGDNGVTYKYVYYIAHSTQPEIGFTDPWNLTQVGEIGKIGWFTAKQASMLFRPDCIERRNTIDCIAKLLAT